jgi:transposase
MLTTVDRCNRLDRAIADMAGNSMIIPAVTRLGLRARHFTLTAFGLATEVGDWHRFRGHSIGAYLGWFPPNTPRVPPAPGAKTGNSHACRRSPAHTQSSTCQG